MLTFLTAFVLSYLYHGFGITVGYHRILTHKSLKVPKWLEYFIVSGGYLAFEGSPIYWITTHRVHHKLTDREGDPHTPLDGAWHSFLGWLYAPKVVIPKEQVKVISPDLCRDKLYVLLDCDHSNWHALLCLTLCVAFRVALFVMFGPVVVIANILGATAPFIGAFLVNSICHMKEHGYRNFETEDLSRNVWWVGLIALGEGWHNNHHAIPQSARHGLKPNEIDISWMYISLLKTLGLAKDIRLPKQTRWVTTNANLIKTYNLTVVGADNSIDEYGVPKSTDELVGASK